MKKAILCAALAGLVMTAAVPEAAQAAVRVYAITGNGCWCVCQPDGSYWDYTQPDEPEWFPGQGGNTNSGQQSPGQSDSPEWFPGQGGNGNQGQQSPSQPDWPEWFPGQGGNGNQGQQSPSQPDWPEWFPGQGGNGNQGQQNPGQQTPSQGGSQARAYIEEVIELVNQERAAAGLSPVTESARLTEAATIRAKETAVSFSHTRPDGSHFSTVLSQNGISYRGAGENIAYGYSTPKAVMNGWMNSAGHRANILNGSYNSIGIGYYQSSDGTIYCTQLFTYSG